MMNSDTAAKIAISGLQYIADDNEQLSRFMALSGVSPGEIREMAHAPEFLLSVLDYFLADEPTLMAFAASYSLDPRDIAKARHALDPPRYPES